MKRLSNKSPCLDCRADRQIGNPYSWQRDCESCEKLANWKAAEANRLSAIEDILGEEYDLYKLRDLVNIGRCKNCKFYDEYRHCKLHSEEPDQCSAGSYVQMEPDDFCSYFEAKTE